MVHSWTPRRARARCRRRIEKLRKLFQEIALDWGDVYDPVVYACDDAGRGLDELSDTIDEAVQHEEARA